MSADECVICNPELLPEEEETGWMILCSEHQPPEEVLRADMLGEDEGAVERWARDQLEADG